MDVMDASVRALRRRRKRYAVSARRRRMLRALRPRFPMAISLPGGRLVERHVYLFWRVRLPLWVVLAAVGWLVLGLSGLMPGLGGVAAGVVLGLAVAILAEFVFSYRPPFGSRPVPTSGPGRGPGDSAGVREPRRPSPTGGVEAAQLPVDPPWREPF
jgi:hypothetical protein